MARKPKSDAQENVPSADPNAPENDKSLNLMDRRAAVLEDVADTRREQLAGEIEEGPDALAQEPEVGEGLDPEPEPQALQPQEPLAPETEPLAAEPEPAAPLSTDEPGDDTMITLMVDGVPTQRSLGELKATGQIEGAARSRLAEAQESLTRIQNIERQAQGAQPPQEAEPPAAQAEPAIDYTELVRSMQYEDPEVAGQKFKEMVNNLQATGSQVDPDVIVQRAVQVSRDETEWREALASFGTEYGDILNVPNEHLGHMVGTVVQNTIMGELRAAQAEQRPRRSWNHILVAAGNTARSALQSWGTAGAQDSPNDPPRPKPGTTVVVDPAKEMRKRATVNPPAARGVQTPATAPANSDPEAVINASRAAGIAELIKDRSDRRLQ